MIGFSELILIAIILLLVLGPSRLAGLGPALGKAIRGFRQGLDGKDEDEAEVKIPKETLVVKDVEVEKDITPPKA